MQQQEMRWQRFGIDDATILIGVGAGINLFLRFREEALNPARETRIFQCRALVYREAIDTFVEKLLQGIIGSI